MIQRTLSAETLAQMSFLLKHLEKKWSIKKRKNVYILKNTNGAKCTYTSAYLGSILIALNELDVEVKRVQLLTFLHNALEGGWNIKKQSNQSDASNHFVFVKKHNGQYKMYEDDEYLTQFIKNNLRLDDAVSVMDAYGANDDVA